jgi:hypothetical protein
MKNKVLILVALCLMISGAVSAHSNVFVNQKLEVMGIAGSPWETETSYEEERARAYLDALNHAYEQIINLPLMDKKEVKHIVQSNRAFKERIGFLLLTSPKTFYQTDLNGINRCKIEVDLSGKNSLRSTFYLAAMRPQPMQPVSFLASWSAGIETDKNAEPSKYKRVVVDARKSYFEPSLFPRFFDRKGVLVFQEAMIPETERFSRPAVRFVTTIEKAREGLPDSQIFTADSIIDELHPRDVVINPTDITEFAIFCNDIVKTPLKEREIVIVFKPDNFKEYGKMKKTEEKKE